MKPQNVKLGIFNLGNTCYINVIMQILFNCDDLNDYVFSNQFFHDLKKKDNMNSLLYKYHVIIRKLMIERKKGKNVKKIKPIEFINKFRNEFSMFSFHQQDAQEGCTYLIDNFHNSIASDINNLQELYNNRIQINMTTDKKLILKSYKSWEQFYKKDYSKLIDIFFGQFINKSTCKTCGYEYQSFEPFNNLQVSVEGCETLLNCFDKNFESETVEDYYCDKCESKQVAEKTHRIMMTPDYLIVQLKRFVFDENRMRFEKIYDNIHFPDYMNLNDYCEIEQSNNFYKLINIVNHIGSSDGGHYYSFNKFEDQWYEFDDDDIREIEEKDIFTKNCYMLVYKRFMK
jgi:ubiquitin C-terminal hydrolase